jgi:hypothetical protein
LPRSARQLGQRLRVAPLADQREAQRVVQVCIVGGYAQPFAQDLLGCRLCSPLRSRSARFT